jgi:hypothetical protein
VWSAGSQALCGGNVNVTAALPAPKMRIVGPASGEGFLIPENTRAGFPIAVNARTQLECVALDIPAVFFQPQYRLQLELLKYRRTNSSKQVVTPARRGSSDWVHPSHGNLVGNDQRGGAHFDTFGNPINMSLRPSEWPITARNQIINVTQGAAGRCVYMRPGTTLYTAGLGPTYLPMPFYVIGNADRCQDRNPIRFRGTPGVLTMPKFRFRYSIVDPDDPRGGRISGPMSPTIVVGNHLPPLYKVTNSSASPVGFIWQWNSAFVSNGELHFFFARRVSA